MLGNRRIDRFSTKYRVRITYPYLDIGRHLPSRVGKIELRRHYDLSLSDYTVRLKSEKEAGSNASKMRKL